MCSHLWIQLFPRHSFIRNLLSVRLFDSIPYLSVPTVETEAQFAWLQPPECSLSGLKQGARQPCPSCPLVGLILAHLLFCLILASAVRSFLLACRHGPPGSHRHHTPWHPSPAKAMGQTQLIGTLNKSLALLMQGPSPALHS